MGNRFTFSRGVLAPMTKLSQLFRGWMIRLGSVEDSVAGVLLSLASDSAQYLVGLVVMGLANMVLLPLYTRYLSPADFGLYALIEVLVLGLISIASLGFNVSYLKWFAESEPAEHPGLLSTALWANGLAGTIAGAALSFFALSSQGTKVLGGDASSVALWLLPLILFETLQNVFLTHLRAKRRAFAFSAVSVIRLVIVAGLSIWLVAGRGLGLVGVFEARVLADLCALLVMWAISASDVSLKAVLTFALPMTKYGLPVVGSSLIMMALDGLGRFFLNHYDSLQDVGLYAVAIKISGLMRMLIVVPFGGAWAGLLFQIAKKPNAKIIYSKLFSYVLVLSIAIALVLSVLSPLLLAVFATKEYADSLPLIPWLLLVQVAVVLQYPASVGIYIGSATKWLIPIFTSGLILSIVLNWLLVPRFGMLGAALAWLGAWIFITTLMSIIGQRYYALHYDWRPLLLVTGLCALVRLRSTPRLIGKIA
jgi:O-antigen/teichoic acid export membrane protein